jgi:crotonobetaine/carnitine-CoA ligase
MIRRRGENVSSVELEAALLRHPAIAQVAAVGIPSPVGEEDIKVCIVPSAGDFEMADFFEFCKVNLPDFAIPRYVELLTTFPVNAMGRVMKHRLQAEGVTARTRDLDAEGFRVDRAERRVTKH